jgi:hypothetical protein
MMIGTEKKARLGEIEAKLAAGSYDLFEGVFAARKLGVTFGERDDAEIDSWGGSRPADESKYFTSLDSWDLVLQEAFSA